MNAPEHTIRDYPARTLADYQADIIARFGCLPPLERLARIESKLARATFGNYQIGSQSVIREDFQNNAARMAILNALVKPMTTRQIVEATGQVKGSVQQAVARGVQGGLIRRHSVDKNHTTIWERVQE